MDTLSILEEVINRKAKKEAVEILCGVSQKLYDIKYQTVYPKGFTHKLSSKNKQLAKLFNYSIVKINAEIKKLDKK